MINKIKQEINKIFNSRMFMLIIGMILFIKTMFFYNNTVGTVNRIQIDTIQGTITFILSLICIINIFSSRARTIIILIVDFLISILLWADNLYYIYSSSK